MRRSALLALLPLALLAQAPLPPAFQNVFPSPFRSPDRPAPVLRLAPQKTKAEVRTPCFPPMPAAGVAGLQSNMPKVKGGVAADPGIVMPVRVCSVKAEPPAIPLVR
jgi:hypothetical protein